MEAVWVNEVLAKNNNLLYAEITFSVLMLFDGGYTLRAWFRFQYYYDVTGLSEQWRRSESRENYA